MIADNRFTVTNSASGFSPFVYPWGWPLLLSPFVKFFGYDYAKLKLLEVVAFCVWMVLVHGVVRRRLTRGVALAITAVVATAPALLAHTDQLLSEYPHAAAVGVFIWWMDRMRSQGRLIDASLRHLWILGALVTVTFSFRRETIVFVGVIGAVQLAELVRDAWGGRSWTAVLDRLPWRQLITPYVSVVVTVAGFQILLPSMLFPDNGNSSAFVDDRIADYTGWLSRHLGLGWHPTVGVVVLVLMLIGMVIAVRTRPGLDGHLTLITLATMFASSTHFRMVDRYYFQVLPWVLYFATVAVGAGVHVLLALVVSGRRDRADGRDRRAERRIGVAWTACTVLPLLFVVAVHAAVLPGDIRDAWRFDDAGRVQIGSHPSRLRADLRSGEEVHAPDRRGRVLPCSHDDPAHRPVDGADVADRADHLHLGLLRPTPQLRLRAAEVHGDRGRTAGPRGRVVRRHVGAVADPARGPPGAERHDGSGRAWRVAGHRRRRHGRRRHLGRERWIAWAP